MKKWIKLETALLCDARIQQLLNSNLGYAGLGMYINIRLHLETSVYERMHINQIVTLGNGRLRPAKIQRLVEEFKLFHLSGDGFVSLARTPADASADASANAPADEHLKDREKNRKEINKEKVFVNGNHDFDPRWD